MTVQETQVQGPNAMDVIERALGASPPELRFFHMTTVTVAGKTVRALRHGDNRRVSHGARRGLARPLSLWR